LKEKKEKKKKKKKTFFLDHSFWGQAASF